MANTAIEVIYTSLKDMYEPGTYQVRAGYVFDDSPRPYVYVYEVSDPRIKPALCAGKGGESRITVGLVTDKYEEAVDGAETILDYIESLRGGSYAPVEIWDIKAGELRDFVDFEQSQSKLYRREFDCLVRWEKV